MSAEKKSATSEEGFKVTDTRASTAEESRASDSIAPEAPGTTHEIPPIDFNTFILSLSTSCLVHLGVVKGPEGHDDKDLPLAKQTIDLLSLFETKTRGNLTGEEERLLTQVLYDLRMRYVAATK